MSDISIIRIFFGKETVWMYKQDLSLYWYEILSEYMDLLKILDIIRLFNRFMIPGSFGGMFGVLSGFSIMSGCEIIYFILKHLLRKIKHHIHVNFQFRKFKLYP